MRKARVTLSFLLCLFLFSCASLQERWDKATEDERARIIISQFQGSLKSSFILAKAFVDANPKYKEEWQTKVVPMFNLCNKLLGDFIEKGRAGEKFTVLQVTASVAHRIAEIEQVFKGWGVRVAQSVKNGGDS